MPIEMITRRVIIALVLPVFLLILTILGTILASCLRCDADAVLMTQLLRNVSTNNNVVWDQFEVNLGFTKEEVNSTTDIDLVKSWINCPYMNIYIFSRKMSVVKRLQQEGYTVEERTIQIFKGFEKCIAMHFGATGVLVLTLLFLSSWILSGCCHMHVFGIYTCRKPRKMATWKELKHCSSLTLDAEKAPVSHSTNEIEAHYEENQVCAILADDTLSVKDETESQDRDEPEIYVNRNRFHRPYDTTLQTSSLELIVAAMKSVGLLFNKNGALGSVVRVGSKFVITAWHVVEHIVHPSSHNFNKLAMNEQLLSASDVYIDFNEYCRQSPKETHFRILPKIVFVDRQLDIVILELYGKEEFLPEPVRSFSDVSSLNAMRIDVKCVHLIGQHPTKELVVADMSCKVIYRNDERVKRAIEWTKTNTPKLKHELATMDKDPNIVSRAYFDVSDTMHRLIFDTFLEFGGSGGAVMTFTPEGDLALVAILIHGLPPFRNDNTSKIPELNTMEVGTTVNAIKDSNEWKPGMEKIKEDIFQMHAAMETDGQLDEIYAYTSS